MFNFPKNNNITYNPIKNINKKFSHIIYKQIFIPIKFHNYNIIYSPNNINPILLKTKYKSIITIHNLLPFKKTNKFNLLQKLYLKFFTYIYTHKSKKITTISNNSKNNIINTLNVKNNKIIITYNILNNFKKSSIHQYNYKPFFFSINTLHKNKQYNLIIKTFLKFKKLINNNYKLLITKNNHKTKKILQNLINKLKLNNHIQLLKYITNKNK